MSRGVRLGREGISLREEGRWYNKGTALGKLGRHKEALSCFDQAIELKPDADAWYSKGLALGNLSKPEDALRCYDQAIKLKPDSADVWYNKGSERGRRCSPIRAPSRCSQNGLVHSSDPIISLVTPAQLVLRRRDGTTVIYLTKEGYKRHKILLISSTHPWWVGNVLFGGVVGVLVDYISGGAFYYQDAIFPTLTPLDDCEPMPAGG